MRTGITAMIRIMNTGNNTTMPWAMAAAARMATRTTHTITAMRMFTMRQQQIQYP